MSTESHERTRTVRRQFLTMRWRGEPTPTRPPWAVAAGRFESTCTRCDACSAACPTGVIVRGSGGFPEIRFAAGECTFCGKCVEACKPRALDAGMNPPWDLAAAITPSCLALNRVVCRTCGEHCEAGAIRFRLAPGGVARPLVDATLCNGCGRCVAGCPVNAIAVRGRNPEVTTA